MPSETKISWTDFTWNPVAGCTKISPGCKNCYAEKLAERFRGTPGHPYEFGFDLRLWPSRLEWPVNKKKPMMIFVNSMSDLFHKDIPLDFIAKVFDSMNRSPQHIFQVLTKRPELMAKYSHEPARGDFWDINSSLPAEVKANAKYLNWAPNIWAGTSIENADYLHRIDSLRQVPANVRFLSMEPLLGRVDYMDLTGIDQVIVGGESGPGARPMEASWAEQIRHICQQQNVAFFFKQMGSSGRDKGGDLLNGVEYKEYPRDVHYPPGLNPYEQSLRNAHSLPVPE